MGGWLGLLLPGRVSGQGGDDGVAAEGGEIFEQGLEAVDGGVLGSAFGFCFGSGGG